MNAKILLHDNDDPMALAITLLQEHYELSRLNSTLKQENYYLRDETSRLKEIIEKLQRQQFGQSSEKLSTIKTKSKEPQIFDEVEPDISVPELEEEDELITVPEHTRKKPGRKGLPQELPKTVVYHDIPENKKICSCGACLTRIGEDITQQLEYIPSKVQILEHVKYKYACKACEQTIITAKLPLQPIPKSIATPGLLAEIVISKYQNHLPLYRQEQIWKALGVELPRGMLSTWMIKIGVLLQPLINLLKDKLAANNYLQADETSVQVLNEPGKTPTSKSFIWLYKTGIDANGVVLYDYQPNRGGHNAENYLHDFAGFLQVDGYAGYDKLTNRSDVTLVSCWAHARRYFVDVAKSSKKSNAEACVNLIGKLYRVERQISDLTFEKIVEIRQEKSKPVIDRLMKFLKELQPKCPPSGSLAKAINYTLEREQSLKVYLEHGFLNIDNNLAENKIRPFAVGRKNWLFMGNVAGAKSSCNIYSLLETAKMNKIDPYTYFRYILEKIPLATNCSELEALLPMNLSTAEIKPPDLA
jgi:transposase